MSMSGQSNDVRAVEEFGEKYLRLKAEVNKVIIGQNDVVDDVPQELRAAQFPAASGGIAAQRERALARGDPECVAHNALPEILAGCHDRAEAETCQLAPGQHRLPCVATSLRMIRNWLAA